MGSESRIEKILAELPEAPDRAARAVERLGGPEVIAAEARKYGLAPLLAHYLPSLIKAQEVEQMGARFNAARLERLSLESLSLLRSAGVEGVLLKGLGIASRLYPSPWLRPAVDVDLLVAPRELERATQALLGAGWKQATAAPQTLFEFSKDIAFAAPRGGMLELHFGYNADFQARFDVDRMVARARTVTLGGEEVRVLSEEDDLLLQCVHAAHHAFQGVKWLFDLKLAALARPRCWGSLPDLAKEYRVASAVGMALREAVRRVRAPVPGDVLRALPPGRVRALAVRRACELEDLDAAQLLNSLLLADRVSWGLVREAAVRPAGRVLTRAGLGAGAKRGARWLAERVGPLGRGPTER